MERKQFLLVFVFCLSAVFAAQTVVTRGTLCHIRNSASSSSVEKEAQFKGYFSAQDLAEIMFIHHYLYSPFLQQATK